MAKLKKVIKMDGREEDFVREKIVVSCVKCGAPIDVARDIAKSIEKELRFPAKTTGIKELVLKELAERDRDWANNWYLYDRAVKRRGVAPY
ncbi:MAG: ATP cone domain-containing protein [Promethearchaeota archaeon]